MTNSNDMSVVEPDRQQQRPSFGDGYLDELNDILKTPDDVQKPFSFVRYLLILFIEF